MRSLRKFKPGFIRVMKQVLLEAEEPKEQPTEPAEPTPAPEEQPKEPETKEPEGMKEPSGDPSIDDPTAEPTGEELTDPSIEDDTGDNSGSMSSGGFGGGGFAGGSLGGSTPSSDTPPETPEASTEEEEIKDEPAGEEKIENADKAYKDIIELSKTKEVPELVRAFKGHVQQTFKSKAEIIDFIEKIKLGEELPDGVNKMALLNLASRLEFLVKA